MMITNLLRLCVLLVIGYGQVYGWDVFRDTQIAAEQGVSDSQYQFAIMYQQGEGTPRNDKKAFLWFHRAAKQGDVSAQYELGAAYYSGRGTQVDLDNAVFWTHKAAVKGHVAAQFSLALTYYYGEG